MHTRRRFKPSVSFQDRLAVFAKDAREHALSLPSGSERNNLLQKADQADQAARLDDSLCRVDVKMRIS